MVGRPILVTGASGFVGGHLLKTLRAAFPGVDVIGTSLTATGKVSALDVTSCSAVLALVTKTQPDVCIHLAGIASPAAARADPDRAWSVNLHGSLNLANAIMAAAPHCTLIFISSGECYGASFRSGLPLDETALPAPLHAYAATKAAADLALGARAEEGLRLLRLRPFNHTGPGQTEAYVMPAFAGQIARIELGQIPPEISVGALTPERDFLDIRDVCDAYTACVSRIAELPANLILNIASGHGVTIQTILEQLLARASCPISIRQDPSRLRPGEITSAVGDASLARNLLDWRPRIPLEQTLDDALNFARQKLRTA